MKNVISITKGEIDWIDEKALYSVGDEAYTVNYDRTIEKFIGVDEVVVVDVKYTLTYDDVSGEVDSDEILYIVRKKNDNTLFNVLEGALHGEKYVAMRKFMSELDNELKHLANTIDSMTTLYNSMDKTRNILVREFDKYLPERVEEIYQKSIKAINDTIDRLKQTPNGDTK